MKEVNCAVDNSLKVKTTLRYRYSQEKEANEQVSVLFSPTVGRDRLMSKANLRFC